MWFKTIMAHLGERLHKTSGNIMHLILSVFHWKISHIISVLLKCKSEHVLCTKHMALHTSPRWTTCWMAVQPSGNKTVTKRTVMRDNHKKHTPEVRMQLPEWPGTPHMHVHISLGESLSFSKKMKTTQTKTLAELLHNRFTHDTKKETFSKEVHKLFNSEFPSLQQLKKVSQSLCISSKGR